MYKSNRVCNAWKKCLFSVYAQAIIRSNLNWTVPSRPRYALHIAGTGCQDRHVLSLGCMGIVCSGRRNEPPTFIHELPGNYPILSPKWKVSWLNALSTFSSSKLSGNSIYFIHWLERTQNIQQGFLKCAQSLQHQKDICYANKYFILDVPSLIYFIFIHFNMQNRNVITPCTLLGCLDPHPQSKNVRI